MNIPFYKFDGAGNDFVVVDNRRMCWQPTEAEVSRICHRRFGVGADGLMTLDTVGPGQWTAERGPQPDFVMHYYNSDGRLGSMCGNGGRCIAAFAHMLGLGDNLHFLAYDGPHSARIQQWDGSRGIVELEMKPVAADGIRRCMDGWFVDTGSPHYVQQVDGLSHFDVVGEGRRIRHMAEYFPQGTNVDFIEMQPDGSVAMRTYERGVEDETWACGTGVTAVALVTGCTRLSAPGGKFRVEFAHPQPDQTTVHLIGPVSLNFTGSWTSSAL